MQDHHQRQEQIYRFLHKEAEAPELQKQFPEYEFTLVIGEDNLAIFDKWREYEYILANFRIFVYPRTSSRQTGGVASAEKGKINTAKPVKELQFLSEAPLFDISSSAIRHSRGLQ